jgi:hypothetical protein
MCDNKNNDAMLVGIMYRIVNCAESYNHCYISVILSVRPEEVKEKQMS